MYARPLHVNGGGREGVGWGVGGEITVASKLLVEMVKKLWIYLFFSLSEGDVFS